MKKVLRRLIAKAKMGWISSLMLVATSCSCGDLTLINYIDDNCAECDTYIIDLKQVYNIDFDKYYIISERQHSEIIADIIKLPYYDYTSDDENILIFIKGKEIVCDVKFKGIASVFTHGMRFRKLTDVALYNPIVSITKSRKEIGGYYFYFKPLN